MVASEMPTEELDAPIFDDEEEPPPLMAESAEPPVATMPDDTEPPPITAVEDVVEPDEPAVETPPPPPPVAPQPVAVGSAELSDAQLDALADKVAERLVEKLGDGALREIAWQVVPELAEAMVKKRIYQLEQTVEEE